MDKAYDIKLHEIEVELYKATKVQPIPPEYEIPTMYDGETTVTPSRELQTLETAGKKISENITVNPIDDSLQDVTNVTATAEDVLSGVKFMDNKGTLQNGEIENKGTVSNILNTQNKAVELQKGYYEGGSVSVDSKELTVTTNGEYQDENFKFYNRVNVNVQTNITEDWQRPSIYPDYSKINLDEGENVCYLTYDCRDAIKGVPAQMACFQCYGSDLSKQMQIERGQIIDGEFVAVYSTSIPSSLQTFSENLPTNEGDFVVYRVRGIDGTNLKYFQFFGNDEILYYSQPCVELYGKFEGATGQTYLGTSYLKYATIYNYSGAIQAFFSSAYSLQGYTIKTEADLLSASLQQMFSECSSLKKIDLSCFNSIVARNVTGFATSIKNLKSINFGNIDTSGATNFSNFIYQTSIKYLDLNGIDVSSCTNFGSALAYNYLLQYLDISSLNFPTDLKFSNSFYRLDSLITLKLPTMYQSFSFSNSSFLSKESLLNMFNNLYDYTTNPKGLVKPLSLTVTIGSKNKTKLTSEEISIATEKGWSVA